MTQQDLAFRIFKWREKSGVQGDEGRDYRCAGHILKVEKNIPLANDWREWERIFEYHYG